jgi:hypothetical protein
MGSGFSIVIYDMARIMSGSVIIDCIFNNQNELNPIKKALKFQTKAFKNSYELIKQKYPKLVHG